MWLEPEHFLEVVRVAPLVAIDLVVRDPAGQVLLGLRKHPPARGYWYTPGGRIRKGETLDNAFCRITQQELGISLERQKARFLGVHEHFHPDNFAGAPGISTHYIVLVYEVVLNPLPAVLPTDQHSAFRWWSVPELLAHPQVHPYTKAYFREEPAFA